MYRRDALSALGPIAPPDICTSMDRSHRVFLSAVQPEDLDDEE